MSIELTKLIADFDTQLAAPVSIGGTTATLVSVTDDDGNTIPNGTYGFTIDAGNSSKEYIICTLTSTTLTAILSVSRQGVTSSGFSKAHRRGVKVTLTDWSSIKSIQNVLETGYASAHTPSTDYELATKKYVDDASFTGATNASTTTPGVVELPTQAEVDAGTASGGLGPLVVTPDTLRARQYNDYAVDSVGTDAYAITITPAITAYAAGQVFTFKAGTANTGACTLNVSGLGAKTIKKDVSTNLQTGDILANQLVMVQYDGTYMQLLSPSTHSEDFGDGSDGDVTISGTTTLTSDMYYNNLVVTGTLNTANWRVFVKGTLSGNGTIQNNGGNGGNGGTPTAGAAGAKVPDGYFSTLPGYIGGAGQSSGTSVGTAGTNGGTSTSSIGVVGVAGGAGEACSGATPAATAGTAGAKTNALQKFGINRWQSISALDFALNGTPAKYTGASGSGSGSGGSARNNGSTHSSGGGGGSGAPGGIMALFINNWTGTVTLKSTGGNGGNGGDGVRTGSDLAGGGGGGAGGSGGVIYVIYKIKSWTGSYVLTGGTGGTKGTGVGGDGDGQNGANGTTGVSYEIQINTLL